MRTQSALKRLSAKGAAATGSTAAARKDPAMTRTPSPPPDPPPQLQRPAPPDMGAPQAAPGRRDPPFGWVRFLAAFIAAPLIVTALTYWAMVPVFALMLGGPLYLVAGLPLAAWYLRRHPFRVLPVLALGQACQWLQVPVFLAASWLREDPGMLEALPAFLGMGALFAFLWTGTFIALYRLLAPRGPRTRA